MSVKPLIFLSIPGLREKDLARMPSLEALANECDRLSLQPSFPCVTWPVQANMLTGTLPARHGIVANGCFDRKSGTLEMWTMPNSAIQAPAIWDRLRQSGTNVPTAVWFPMLAKECSAEFACMPAPVHNPDGSESLWCYTKPTEWYGELFEQLGHFPLQNFWGPLAGRPASEWIVKSALFTAAKYRPEFFYIYLPHLDYAAQRTGPDSMEAMDAVQDLDVLLKLLHEGMTLAYASRPIQWMVASEYVITNVDTVVYPNRVLRELGLIRLVEEDGREQLDLANSPAWCLVDHQCGHVFVRDRDPAVIRRIAAAFTVTAGIADVLTGDELAAYGLDHERSGDVVLISERDSWQAYYWWEDPNRAPAYARRVDIHRKPGYDPVELFWDREANGVPLDATRVRGSHGAPAQDPDQRGVFLCPHGLGAGSQTIRDIDVFGVIERAFTDAST